MKVIFISLMLKLFNLLFVLLICHQELEVEWIMQRKKNHHFYKHYVFLCACLWHLKDAGLFRLSLEITLQSSYDLGRIYVNLSLCW